MAAKRIGRALVAAAALIVLAAAGYGFVSKPATPAVTFTTLGDEKIGLADLRGKIVLVNFWATSCGICMAEMPDLVAAYRQFRDRGFEVIAIAMHYDEPELVRGYATKQALPFPVVFDKDGKLAREFDQVGATPTTFIIDRSGKRISKTLGIINFDKLRAFLESPAPAEP
jgi:peroxiredoxin